MIIIIEKKWDILFPFHNMHKTYTNIFNIIHIPNGSHKIGLMIKVKNLPWMNRSVFTWNCAIVKCSCLGVCKVPITGMMVAFCMDSICYLGLCNGMCPCKIYVTGYVDIVTSLQHVHLISCICSYNTTKLRDVHVCLLYAFMARCSSTNN